MIICNILCSSNLRLYWPHITTWCLMIFSILLHRRGHFDEAFTSTTSLFSSWFSLSLTSIYLSPHNVTLLFWRSAKVCVFHFTLYEFSEKHHSPLPRANRPGLGSCREARLRRSSHRKCTALSDHTTALYPLTQRLQLSLTKYLDKCVSEPRAENNRVFSTNSPSNNRNILMPCTNTMWV